MKRVIFIRGGRAAEHQSQPFAHQTSVPRAPAIMCHPQCSDILCTASQLRLHPAPPLSPHANANGGLAAVSPSLLPPGRGRRSDSSSTSPWDEGYRDGEAAPSKGAFLWVYQSHDLRESWQHLCLSWAGREQGMGSHHQPLVTSLPNTPHNPPTMVSASAPSICTRSS